jgi:hypothetical protein
MLVMYTRSSLVVLTLFEGGHGKHTREDTLVVTVQQATQASKTRNTKHPRVLDQSHRPRSTRERFAASQSGHLKATTTTTDRSHVNDSDAMFVKGRRMSVKKARSRTCRVSSTLCKALGRATQYQGNTGHRAPTYAFMQTTMQT